MAAALPLPQPLDLRGRHLKRADFSAPAKASFTLSTPRCFSNRHGVFILVSSVCQVKEAAGIKRTGIAIGADGRGGRRLGPAT
jgi:hypothetical protein